MESVKKLEEIKKMLHEKNEHWWKEERTDLDLKYYVPTDLICETLLPYEVGIPKNIYDEVLGGDEHYNWWYDNSYSSYLEKKCIEDLGGDNTYNHTGRPQNDINWQTYKMENDKYIVVLEFHLGGDIRGNYTDEVVLEFEYDTQFLDVLNEISYQLCFDLEVDGKEYTITPFVLDECLDVYDIEKEDNIYHIFGINDEEVTEQIREQVEKTYQEDRKEVIMYMLKNGIINENQYNVLVENNKDNTINWNDVLIKTKEHISNNKNLTDFGKEMLLNNINSIIEKECI